MTKALGPAGREMGRAELVVLVAALSGVNAIAIDVMLPALPALGQTLRVAHDNDPQLIISAYLLGLGGAQLLAGPLADRFGRRLPLLVGLAVYVLAALLAPAAPSLPVLIALRVVQGIAAAGTVLGQAIVRDRFSGAAMAEVLSLANMAFMAVPVVAPAIGQGILAVGMWQHIFLLMAGLGAAMWLWIFFRLPETLAPESRRAFHPTVMLQGFGAVLRERSSVAYGLGTMCLMGSLFGLINSVQQVFVGIYGLGVLFPLAFALVAALQSAAAFVNARLVGPVGVRNITHLAVLAYTLLAAGLAAASLAGNPPFALFYGLLLPVMFFFTWANSNMVALAMEPLGRVAGTAASAFGVAQLVGGTLIGMAIGQAFDGTTRPLSLGYFAMGLLAVGATLLAERGRLFGRTAQASP